MDKKEIISIAIVVMLTAIAIEGIVLINKTNVVIEKEEPQPEPEPNYWETITEELSTNGGKIYVVGGEPQYPVTIAAGDPVKYVDGALVFENGKSIHPIATILRIVIN